jgi:hypothetical protein
MTMMEDVGVDANKTFRLIGDYFRTNTAKYND